MAYRNERPSYVHSGGYKSELAVSKTAVTKTAMPEILGEHDILNWINATLREQYRSSRDILNGDVACRIWNEIVPDSIPRHLIVSDAMQTNYLLLHDTLQSGPHAAPSELSFSKLMQGHVETTLNLFRWLVQMHIQLAPANAVSPIFGCTSMYAFAPNGDLEACALPVRSSSPIYKTPIKCELPDLTLFERQEAHVLEALKTLDRRLRHET